ncbi:Hypothetical protein CINCED_3A018102 [Cinara cedri]|uniref:Uncharacterized protein n=1 Tax=Cinara cedri TaxID=506608 RepID=A0A5E4NKR5_9HEMI|nr:Hypothetical protein CINCED_3A018102 [Cinara cedri]
MEAVKIVWKPEGKTPRGRPRKRWFDVVEEDLKTLRVENWRETDDQDCGGKMVNDYGELKSRDLKTTVTNKGEWRLRDDYVLNRQHIARNKDRRGEQVVP